VERKGIADARRLQRIASWVQQQSGHVAAELRQDVADDPSEAASAWRSTLGVDAAEQLAWSNHAAAFSSWRAALERSGVAVVQYPLGGDGIRGFSLPDRHLPIIGVNTAYNVAARVYTVFHELGHLATRTSSACVGFVPAGTSADPIEGWCERFAAALLLPESDVREWLAARADSGVPSVSTVRALAAAFKVSGRAGALRLIGLGVAPSSLYRQVENRFVRLDHDDRLHGGGPGKRTPHLRLHRLGRLIPATLWEAADRELISRRDVLADLRISTGDLEEIRQLLGEPTTR
jgi:Zn-dependent peptidase ImmA (M78 family)